VYTAVTNLTYRKLLRLSEDPLYTTCPSSRTSSSFDKGQLAPPNTPQLLRCSTSNPRTQSAVTTMWGVLGGRAVNLPILYGHLPSDHISFFSHYLLILYHRWRQMSRVYYCVNSEVGKGIEPHPTNEYHSVFFLTTLRLMERPLSRHLAMP